MMMKVVDAKDMVLGRLATYCAKQALLGEEITVVNCRDAVITGDPKRVLSVFKEKRERGDVFKGPFQPRRADLIVKRVIRGMIPYKTPRGEAAFKRVRCYVGVPEGVDVSKAENLGFAEVKNTKALKYAYIRNVSESMGVHHGR